MNIGMPVLFFDWVIGKICLFAVGINVTTKTISDLSPSLLNAYSIAPIPLKDVASRIVLSG